MTKTKGLVIKILGGEYLVSQDYSSFRAKARKTLKRGEIIVGDTVTLENDVIVSVDERKNRLIRPNISNVDGLVIVVAPKPKPDFYLVDKLLINADIAQIPVKILVNKCDTNESFYDEIVNEYKDTGVDIVRFSAKTGEGLNLLKNMQGRLIALAGQSAVGKTSIINAAFNLNLRTGELTEKIERGKHTTTSSEIYFSGDKMLADTPGFAVIFADCKKEELANFYNEYIEPSALCKFRGCSHIREPNCMVKNLVEKGKLSKTRYNRYIEIYNELLNGGTNYEQN